MGSLSRDYQRTSLGMNNIGPDTVGTSRQPQLDEIKLTLGDLDADGILRCPITRESMEVGATAVRLNCNHLFDPNAIRHWLGRSNTCPVCRAVQPNSAPPVVEQPTPVPTYQRERFLTIMIGTHARMASSHERLSRQYANELHDINIAHIEQLGIQLRILAAHNVSQLRLLREQDSPLRPGQMTLEILALLEDARRPI